MRIQPGTRFLRRAAVGSGILFLLAGLGLGCGGQGGSSGPAATGGLLLHVEWPARSGRYIPAAANSLKVIVTQEGKALAEAVLVRPEDGAPATQVISGLPVGTVWLEVTAYATPDGTGTPLAAGTTTAKVSAGTTQPVHLTLASTVARIEISPAQVTVKPGETLQMTALALDSRGNIVIGVDFTWATSDENIARIDAQGLLTGVAEGTVTISATGDGKTGSTTAVILPDGPPGGRPNLGEVIPVPMVSNVGTITLPTPNGDESYLLILYSLGTSSGLTFFQINGGTEPLPPPISRARSPEYSRHGDLRRWEDALAPLGLSWRSREPTRQAPQVGDQREFWASAGGSFIRITATLKRLGVHSYIYVDNRTPAGVLTLENLQELGSEFDSFIYPTMRRVYGAESNVDGDPLITILFTQVVNAQEYSGFFHPNDLFPDQPYSNGREMFYMRIPDAQNPYDRLRSKLKAVLAHEMQHMINYNQHVFVRKRPLGEALWLNEALSHVAQDVVGYPETNVNFVRDYLANPPETSVTRPTRNADDAERGAEYLFLRYLVDQGGEGLLGRLVQTGERDIANVEAATGRTLAQLFRDWTAAVFLSNTGLNGNPRYNYTSINLRAFQNDLNRTYLNGPAENVLLFDRMAVRGTLAYGGVRYLRFVQPTRKEYSLTLTGGPNSQLEATVIRIPPLHRIYPPIPEDGFDGIWLDAPLPTLYRPGQVVSVTGRILRPASQVTIFFIPKGGGNQIPFQDLSLNMGRFQIAIQFDSTQVGHYQVGISLDHSDSPLYDVEVGEGASLM